MAEGVHVHEIGDLTVTTIVSGRYRENGYVVTDRRACVSVAIDPGGRADQFTATIAEAGGVFGGIALTHGHFDHVGAVHELAQHHVVPCWLEARDEKLAKQASLFAIRFEGARIRSPIVTTFDAPGRIEPAHGLRIDVLHTPGHTPGSVAFLLPGVAFVGDLVFRELVGPTIYPGSDRGRLVDSVSALLDTISPDTMLFAGHGRPWTAGEAREWWRRTSDDPPAMELFGEPRKKPESGAVG